MKDPFPRDTRLNLLQIMQLVTLNACECAGPAEALEFAWPYSFPVGDIPYDSTTTGDIS